MTRPPPRSTLFPYTTLFRSKSQMSTIALKDQTIPHEIQTRFCGAHILLRPASPGTGVIAGKTVRAVLESVGIKDVLSKSLGSKNAANVVKATLNALLQLRLKEQIYKSRGLEVKIAPKPPAPAPATPARAATPAAPVAAPASPTIAAPVAPAPPTTP